MLNKIKNLSN